MNCSELGSVTGEVKLAKHSTFEKAAKDLFIARSFNICLCMFHFTNALCHKPCQPHHNPSLPSLQSVSKSTLQALLLSFLNAADVQEGLTTSHLKKAKLMFFFTRYPSSHTLRMCFHDVQVSERKHFLLGNNVRVNVGRPETVEFCT